MSGPPADTACWGRCHAPMKSRRTIPDRRRATQRKVVRPNGRQPERESARRRSRSLHLTSDVADDPIETASLAGAAGRRCASLLLVAQRDSGRSGRAGCSPRRPDWDIAAAVTGVRSARVPVEATAWRGLVALRGPTAFPREFRPPWRRFAASARLASLGGDRLLRRRSDCGCRGDRGSSRATVTALWRSPTGARRPGWASTAMLETRSHRGEASSGLVSVGSRRRRVPSGMDGR